jgi:aryl-alcohol dehydrogenase-like predicted oxidoreductase
MQSESSLWTRFPELGMLQACAELGVAFVAFSPVARGALSGRLRDIEALPAGDFRKNNPRFTGLNWKRNLARIDAYVALARGFGRDPCELAIAWALAQGPHVLAIPGTRYTDNLAHNARAAAKPLTPSEAQALARALPVGWAAGDRYTDAQWANIERYC